MAFFFTTPNRTMIPSIDRIDSDWWNISSDRSANGTVSGSEIMIVTGCSHDSNCAARTRYMKMNESPMFHG